MKNKIWLFSFLLICKIGFSQNTIALEKYLKNNKTTIDLNELEKQIDVFKTIMQGKNLFVLGEGGHHQLQIYNQLRAYLPYQFAKSNLKYFFIEWGRSHMYLNNQYLQNKYNQNDSIFAKYPEYDKQMKKLRTLYQNGTRFEFRGIDNERAFPFFKALKSRFIRLYRVN